MTESASTNKILSQKLDVLVDKVTRIEERLINQPKIDVQKEKNINQKFDTHDKRITSLESNQKWFLLAILGTIINAVMQLVLR